MFPSVLNILQRGVFFPIASRRDDRGAAGGLEGAVSVATLMESEDPLHWRQQVCSCSAESHRCSPGLRELPSPSGHLRARRRLLPNLGRPSSYYFRPASPIVTGYFM